MLERLHPFTSLGALLMAAALPFFRLGDHPQALVLLFLAHGFALLEFRKYTSNYQFALILCSATAMGVALDLLHSTWPWTTLTLLTAATSTIARQAFMQRFTYVNLLWLDTGMALLALTIHTSILWGRPFQWDLWLLPMLPMGFATGLTFSYVQDAHHMRKRTRFGYRVQPGQPAPGFELPDEHGTPVRLADYLGKHPVLLIFVRGDWCPGCHMMLRTYERSRERFMQRGVHVLAIGPDDIAVNRDMARRIGVGFRMLSDAHQQVSGRYGVVYGNPVIELGVDYAEGIPLPASFLVDVEGVVRYVSRPDRVGEFLDPELIFGVLDQLPVAGLPVWN